MHIERDISEYCNVIYAERQIANLQNLVTRRMRSTLSIELDITTNHESCKLLGICSALAGNMARHSPIAQYSHSVGDLDNFTKFVTDKHN